MGSNGEITIDLIDSIAAIEKKVNKALAQEVNRRIRKNVHRLRSLVQVTLRGWVREQPEIISLAHNGVPESLNAHFGLGSQSLTAIDDIIKAVVQTVKIHVPPIADNLKGTITFTIQPTDFNNLLSLPTGHNLLYRKSDLHWLDWLLLKGDSAIIIGYHYDAEFGVGRSGGGDMDEGGMWRVPPQFSGTSQNNFITRALDGREKQLTRMFEGLLEG